MDKVILKKDGFWTSEWNSDTRKYDVARLDLSTQLFLRSWSVPMEIKGKVTLKDLVAVLKSMDPFILECVAKLTGANLEEYLKEDLEPARDPDRKTKLKFIEVFKYFEMDNYNIETWKIHEAITAHGIGQPWEDGCKDVPLEKRGNSYAIEFTPWKYMMNLPIRLKTSTTLRTVTWKRGKKRKVSFFKKNGKRDGKPLFETDRESIKHESQDINVIYTVGDFFTGLFDELCWFWTPASREKQSEELTSRLEDVKVNSEEDYLELKEHD